MSSPRTQSRKIIGNDGLKPSGTGCPVVLTSIAVIVDWLLRMKTRVNYRKLAGYSLLIISCIAWAVLPVIPFLPFDGGQLATWGAGVFIFAEITWWLAMPLLGKELIEACQLWWGKCKAWFKREGR